MEEEMQGVAAVAGGWGSVWSGEVLNGLAAEWERRARHLRIDAEWHRRKNLLVKHGDLLARSLTYETCAEELRRQVVESNLPRPTPNK